MTVPLKMTLRRRKIIDLTKSPEYDGDVIFDRICDRPACTPILLIEKMDHPIPGLDTPWSPPPSPSRTIEANTPEVEIDVVLLAQAVVVVHESITDLRENFNQTTKVTDHIRRGHEKYVERLMESHWRILDGRINKNEKQLGWLQARCRNWLKGDIGRIDGGIRVAENKIKRKRYQRIKGRSTKFK